MKRPLVSVHPDASLPVFMQQVTKSADNKRPVERPQPTGLGRDFISNT